MRVLPTEERIEKLSVQLEEFCSSQSHPASLWPSLLGRMFSLSLLVPGSRLRMRSFKLCLKRNWDLKDEDKTVHWENSCLGWSDKSNLTPGIPLESLMPDLYLYKDASDQGWGASMDSASTSGLWSDPEKSLSINHRELLVIQQALLGFQGLGLRTTGSIVLGQHDSRILSKEVGGTRSPLNSGIVRI